MINFFSEKNLRKGLRFRPSKKFKKKIKCVKSLYAQSGSSKLICGDFGFRALSACKFTSRQLDSIRRSLMPIRRIIHVWVRIKDTLPLTKKPVNSRMGKGKGKYRCVVGNILKNEIILEFTCLDFYFYSSFIYSAISKLPVRIELVFNENRINTFSVRRFEEPDSLYQEFYEIT